MSKLYTRDDIDALYRRHDINLEKVKKILRKKGLLEEGAWSSVMCRTVLSFMSDHHIKLAKILVDYRHSAWTDEWIEAVTDVSNERDFNRQMSKILSKRSSRNAQGSNAE